MLKDLQYVVYQMQSYLTPYQVDEYLKDKSKPIWVSLSQGQVELYR